MASTNQNRVTKIKDLLKSQITQHFSATLLREPDIVNIVNALIFRESGFNANALGNSVGYYPRTGGAAYFNSSAVNSKFQSPDSTPMPRDNIFQGLRAMGLMQVMGWYFVRGGNPTGKSEMEQLRPDLAPSLMVNPGDSIVDKILGEANMDKAILAGLIILEGKYRYVKTVSSGSGIYFTVPGDPYSRKFVSKMQAAISAYLGLGKMDMNGTTPESYSASILGGSAYAKANGTGSLFVRDSEIKLASSASPQRDTTLAAIKIPGCSA